MAKPTAKELRAKASGKKKIYFETKRETGEDGKKYSTPERKVAKTLEKTGLAKTRPQTKKESKSELASYEESYTKGAEKGRSTATTKNVNVDAYNTLGQLADAKNLTGKARDKAIKSALKVVAQRMQSDRNRTANRAEAIEKREKKKTTKSNKTKLIGG